MMKVGKKIALCGLFTALALISFLLENLVPPLFVPGAKMGLSNAFILLALVFLGAPYGFIALILKCVLGSIFSGNISAILYSLPSGLISLTAEYLLLRFTKNVSVVAISVAGAVINSCVQNAIFCLVTESLFAFTYLPYLAIIGTVGGVAVGLIVFFIIKAMPKGYKGG